MIVNGTAGNDSLTGTEGDDSISGLGGSDTINALGGNDTLDGGVGIDTLNGGLGNDTYIVTEGDVLSDTGGIDTVVADITWSLADAFENLTATGSAAVSLTGNNGANLLVGNSGNNFFNPRGGNDTINGGAGNDWVALGGGGVANYGTEVVDGGTGFDTLDFGTAKSAIVLDLGAGTLVGGGEAGVGSASLTGIESAIGGAFNDRLSGSAAAESLVGGAGNDTLDGRGGNDTLAGGLGQDTFVFASAPGSGNVEQVTDFVSATDKLTFDNAVFTALGAPGNFAAGDARFAAGAGFTSGQDASDRLVYNTTTGQLFYDADGNGAGASQLIATLQAAPALTATDIVVTGQTGPNVIRGTAGNDSLTGTEANDMIDGLAGNDTLDGFGGDDQLNGGTGNDLLIGNQGADLLSAGDGDDTLDGASDFFQDHGELTRDANGQPLPGDTLDGGLGNDVYLAQHNDVIADAGGIDTVFTDQGRYTLPGGLENLTYQPFGFSDGEGIGVSYVGNELDNTIRVQSLWINSGADIDGGDGNDLLISGVSNDRLFGGRGNDTLMGAGSDFDGDSYSGGDGDDRLVSVGAYDTLSGGTGADSFVIARAPISDDPGAPHMISDFVSGTDKIVLDGTFHRGVGSSGNFTADDPRFFAAPGASTAHDATDRVIYNTSTGELFYDEDGTGTAAALFITHLAPGVPLVATDIAVENGSAGAAGTAGNDSLTGTEGNDSISGLAGNDTIDGQDGSDSLSGGAGRDSLVGGNGNDTLDGGPGGASDDDVDTMDGGLGDDTFIVNNQFTRDVLTDSGGIDTVVAVNFSSWDLGSGFENLILTGQDPGAFDAALSTGNELNNVMRSEMSLSVLDGADGNDTLIGNNDGGETFVFSAGSGAYGNDVVDGGTGGGFDLLEVGARSGAVVDFRAGTVTGGGTGGSGSVHFTNIERAVGGSFDDRLLAGDTGVFLSGEGGNDTLIGGSGNDTLGEDRASDFFPNDTGNDQIFGGGGDDRIFGSQGNDLLDGGAGNDTFAYDDAGDLGADTIVGGDGVDTLAMGGSGALVADLGAGSVTMTGSPNPIVFSGIENFSSGFGNFNDRIIGDAGANELFAGGADDTLVGGTGDDTLIGGSSHPEAEDGNDWLEGGQGADSLVGAHGGDSFVFRSPEDGADRIADFASFPGSPLSSDRLVFDNTGFTALGASGQFGSGDQRFFAGAGATSGQDATDRIVYNTTTGQLFYDADGSGAGASQLIATLQGAPALAATDIVVSGQAQPSNQATAGDDSLTGTAGNDSINGLAGNDTINGLGGNDTIDGGTGADAMIGGAGDDLFFVDNDHDGVVEFENGGMDEVRSSADHYTMPDWVNSGTLVGSAVISLFGNAIDNFMSASSVTHSIQLDGFLGNDTLIGGSAGDELNGWEGNDSMVGGEGNDTFDGFNHPQAGADTMIGGAGDDIYFVDSAGDVTIEEAGGGVDAVQASASYTLGAFVNNLTLIGGAAINGTGNEIDNVLRGNGAANVLSGLAGNDTLDGGAGIDTLNGGLGNDTYVVTAGDVLSDAGGIDTVFSDVNWGLADGFENLTATGSAAVSLTGNNGANLLVGNSGNNFFNPRGGDDTIQGGAGNDWIALGGGGVANYGTEVVDGGAGFDTLDFGTAKSAIVVNLGAGTLVGGGEAGVGSASLISMESAIGGAFNDRLSGSAAAESMIGGAGNDTLSGLGGNDTLTGGLGADSFVFASAPGAGNVDLVTDFVSATDKLALDNAAFTALGADGNFAAGDARFAAGAGFTSGRDASDRMIYNTSTGQLFYDADGSGAGAAQLVATLQGNPAITATDLAVI